MKTLHGLVLLKRAFSSSALAVLVCTSAAFGIDEKELPVHLKTKDDIKYTTDALCYQCHFPGTFMDKKALDRVVMNESAVWEQSDYHKDAVKVLLDDRATRMGKLLGIADVSKDARCTSCHAGNCEVAPASVAGPGPVVLENLLDADAQKQNGVACQACHGPGTQWVLGHQTNEWWRKPIKDKVAVGLRDVRTPHARADLCLSCHLGSSREGKVLTHDMYAAGHPPLPSFEVESYLKIMPHHGKYLADKSAESRADYPEPEFYTTKAMLTAAMVAVRLQVELAADGGRWASSGRWPELALFDCAACHHELEVDSFRQKRGYAYLPGRIQMRSWPTALYRAAGGSTETLKPLLDAFGMQPFGNPIVVADAGKSVASAIDGQIAEFAKKNNKMTPDAALAVLRKVCEIGSALPPDFDDARQLAFAVRIIRRDLDAADAQKLNAPPVKAALDAVSAWAEDHLVLKLTDKKADRKPLVVNAETLEKAISYRPEEFQQAMKKLGEAIGPAGVAFSTR